MPKVSIGVAVYNGENFLNETLNSLLNQTYKNFELIISDNASTDRTQEICREYAARDQRIRYFRNKKNLGVARNFNRVFELSTGQYFKWNCHDDLCAPKYIEQCVEVLDREPSVIICHPKTIIIDKNGNYLKDYDDLLDFRSSSPHERFRDYLFRPAHMWNAVCGLIRSSELRKTALTGNYRASDRILLGELALRGKIFQLSERLFYRRFHPQQAWRANPTAKALTRWYDPESKKWILLPIQWKLFYEYLLTIRRVQLSWHEQTLCYLYMTWWGAKHLMWSPLRKSL